MILYDEYIKDDEETEKKRDKLGLAADTVISYDWNEIGLSHETADAMGLHHKYGLSIYKDEALAVGKFVLVHKRGKTPEEADAEIEHHPTGVLTEFSDYIHEAFSDIAHDYMGDAADRHMAICAALKCQLTDEGYQPNEMLDEYILNHYTELNIQYDWEKILDWFPEERIKETRKTFDAFKNVKLGWEIKYGEYIKKNYMTEDDEKFGLEYDWDDVGIPGTRAIACGYSINHPYEYKVPKENVKAIIKHFLVHDEGMEAGEKLDLYINENFEDLECDYDEEIRDAYSRDAERYMKKLTESRIDLVGGEDYFVDNSGKVHDYRQQSKTSFREDVKAEKEETTELLKWRPKDTDMPSFPPRAVQDARLGLLSEDDQKLVNKAFSSEQPGNEFRCRFFGAPVKDNKNPEWMQTALVCVKVAPDADTAKRIFEASAAYDRVRDTDGMFNVVDQDGKVHVNDFKGFYEGFIDRTVKLNEKFAKQADREYKQFDIMHRAAESGVGVTLGERGYVDDKSKSK